MLWISILGKLFWWFEFPCMKYKCCNALICKLYENYLCFGNDKYYDFILYIFDFWCDTNSMISWTPLLWKAKANFGDEKLILTYKRIRGFKRFMVAMYELPRNGITIDVGASIQDQHKVGTQYGPVPMDIKLAKSCTNGYKVGVKNQE